MVRIGMAPGEAFSFGPLLYIMQGLGLGLGLAHRTKGVGMIHIP